MSLDQVDNSDKIAQNAEQIQTIKAELDALQVHVMGVAKPWYKQASTLIAILALAFSFGTTFVSYYRTAQLDKHAAQVELRSLMQRIVALPRENFEVFQKYKTHPLEANQMAGFINNENLVLTQQAATILDKIPDLVSGAEYYAIGQGLISSGIVERGIELFEKAALRATTAATAVAAYRSLGAAAYNSGQFETGQRAWRAALGIFKTRFPNAPQVFQNFTHAQTMTRWAQVESAVGECEAANGHLRDARQYLRALPKAGSEPILREIQQTEVFVSNCHAAQNVLLQTQ